MTAEEVNMRKTMTISIMIMMKMNLNIMMRHVISVCSIYLKFLVLHQVNQSENELAMEMSKVDNRSLSDFEIFHEKLETLLHPKHYLMIMLKRHLVHLYSTVLAQLDDEDLERVNSISLTRSLGTLRAPTSSWRPFRAS